MHNEKKEENNALFGFAIVAAAIGIVTLLYYPLSDVKPRHSCRGYKSQISLDNKE